MWMVRAGEGGRLIHDFKEKNIIALGFNEIGEVLKANTLEEIKDLYRKAYPSKNELAVGINSSQIYNFLNNFKEGDYVISYDPKERTYYIGQTIGDYEYNEKLIEKGYNKIRKVNWIKTISRDDLSISTKNALGPRQAIFKIKDENKEEILSILKGEKITPEKLSESEETLKTIMKNTLERAHEFIKDKIMDLDWEEMQELIAGILRAMGYKTIITGKGSDRGKDIVASIDGLGLEGPKIKVEVKHRNKSIGAPDIRNFIGGLRKGQKGLYISTGGFSTEASYEAERSIYPLTLIDADMIVDLITQSYDNFDIETRSLIPLKKIYWPVVVD